MFHIVYIDACANKKMQWAPSIGKHLIAEFDAILFRPRSDEFFQLRSGDMEYILLAFPELEVHPAVAAQTFESVFFTAIEFVYVADVVRFGRAARNDEIIFFVKKSRFLVNRRGKCVD
jgi:hypothetical protein